MKTRPPAASRADTGLGTGEATAIDSNLVVGAWLPGLVVVCDSVSTPDIAEKIRAVHFFAVGK